MDANLYPQVSGGFGGYREPSLWLSRDVTVAPITTAMEPRPLTDDPSGDRQPADDPGEPRLELVPALDDPEAAEAETEELEPADDAEELEAAELEALEQAVQAQDPLKLYVRSIGGGPLLTRAEERELARLKDMGDEAAKRKLIESNLRLVMSITRNYTKAGVPLRLRSSITGWDSSSRRTRRGGSAKP